MRARFMGEAAVLLLLSATIYFLGNQFQNYFLQKTEYAPGVNWIYLPAGLRVLLVLVAGVWGALGICFSTLLIDLQQQGHFADGMLWATALHSGFGACAALHAMYVLGRIDRNLKGLQLGQLLAFALLYAVVSCLGQHLIGWFFGKEAHHWYIDIWPMLVGDLAGAASVLLLFRWSLRHIKNLLPQRIVDDQT